MYGALKPEIQNPKNIAIIVCFSDFIKAKNKNTQMGEALTFKEIVYFVNLNTPYCLYI